MAKPRRIKPFRATARCQPYRACARRGRIFPFFLSLPAELRELVYSMLLYVPGGIDVTGYRTGILKRPALNLNLSLLCVSKQVAAEAGDYFFTANTFALLEDCWAPDWDKHEPMQSPVYNWLKNISRHGPLLRSIQLSLRRERPIEYHTTHFLPLLADVAPNLTRLALIAECNRTRPKPGVIIDGVDQMHRAYPLVLTIRNVVERLSEDEMRRVCQALREASFKKLRLVQFSAVQDYESLDRVCLAVGCRVQAIGEDLAERDAFAVAGSMWEDVKREALYYDAVPGRRGEGVRRLVEAGGGEWRTRKWKGLK